MHIVIITGGNIDIDFASNYLTENQPNCIVAADHGLEACFKLDIMPDYVYGDFDSVQTQTYAYYAEKIPERIYKFSAKKDETDTELALRETIKLIKQQESSETHIEEIEDIDDSQNLEQTSYEVVPEITILGATGTRLDHVFGNLHLLKSALDAGIHCQIVDEHNRICLLDSNYTMYRDHQFGDYVSFLPFTSKVEGLTLKGFEYPLEDYTLEAGTARGVSNEIKDEAAEISMTSGILVMFETRD